MNNFEIVTALTIASIGAIISLYFIVLKKKGWLTEETKSTTSYLCSNPQCRKVFQEPIKLTDLSKSPPVVYLGCPHCGIDMEKIPAATTEKSNVKHDIPQSNTVTRETLETPNAEPINESLTETKPPPARNRKNSTDSQPSPQPKPSVQTTSILVETTQKSAEKPEKKPEQKPEKVSAVPKNCQHFMGYVKTLPKSTPIPDECMWCTSIVKCLTGAEKIEA